MIKTSKLTKNTYSMPLDAAIEEHEELVNFLEHPTQGEDRKELNEQGGELKEMLAEKRS